jgi:hypothetical protein
MNRASSTRIGCYLDCPRKFWYEHTVVGDQPVIPNRPMAVGTVFHALVEFYQTNGRWPSRREFDSLPGNYEAPRVAAALEAGVYEEAEEMAFYLEAERPDLLELPEDSSVEFNLETLDLEFYPGGPKVGGYLDVFIPSERLIRDWKSRGSFAYMPRNLDDFMKNVQLCYYGAAMAYYHGWDSIVVEHVNVLRPSKGGPLIEPIRFEIPSWYLQGVWTHLSETVVPAMVETYAASAPGEVERNTAACWNYGRCAHMAYCEPAYDEPSPVDDALALLVGGLG